MALQICRERCSRFPFPPHFMHLLAVIRAASSFWQGAEAGAAYNMQSLVEGLESPWSSGARWQQRWTCSTLRSA